MTAKQRRKQIDQRVEFVVRRDCSGLAISVMDIGKVFDAAYLAADGSDVDPTSTPTKSIAGRWLAVDTAVVRLYRELSEACRS